MSALDLHIDTPRAAIWLVIVGLQLARAGVNLAERDWVTASDALLIAFLAWIIAGYRLREQS